MRLVLVVLVGLATPAQASWTFCIAESGRHIWITDVFAAAQPRERLEASFVAELTNRGVTHAVAQCPAPQDDKTDVVKRSVHGRGVPPQSRRRHSLGRAAPRQALTFALGLSRIVIEQRARLRAAWRKQVRHRPDHRVGAVRREPGGAAVEV